MRLRLFFAVCRKIAFEQEGALNCLTGMGRLSRSGCHFTLALLLCGLVVAARNLSREYLVLALMPLGWMYHVAVTRRLHDIGRSGWRQILSPRFAVMGLGFVPSDPHPNAYGPRPRKAAAREQLPKGTSDTSVTMVAQC